MRYSFKNKIQKENCFITITKYNEIWSVCMCPCSVFLFNLNDFGLSDFSSTIKTKRREKNRNIRDKEKNNFDKIFDVVGRHLMALLSVLITEKPSALLCTSIVFFFSKFIYRHLCCVLWLRRRATMLRRATHLRIAGAFNALIMARACFLFCF